MKAIHKDWEILSRIKNSKNLVLTQDKDQHLHLEVGNKANMIAGENKAKTQLIWEEVT